MTNCTVTAPMRKTHTNAGPKAAPQDQAHPSSRNVEEMPLAQAATSLSGAQLEEVLTQVANDSNALYNLLGIAQVSKDDDVIMRLVDAAQIIVERIGGMADSAIGGSVIGDYNRWNFGPNFAASAQGGAA